MGRVRSPKRRVRDDDFIVGYRRISSDIVGLSSNRLSIGGSIQGVSAEILSFKISWQAQYLVRLEGDFTCSHALEMTFESDADHWWHSFCVAGAVFGEVGGWLYCVQALEMTFHMWRRSLMTFIFAWQAQYLVRLRGAFTASTHWKWGFICDADQPNCYLVRFQVDFACCAYWTWWFICDADHWWHWFCVAGAVFGEVGGWLFVAGALLRDILGDSRSAKCCILQYKIVSKMGRVRSPKRRVRDDDFILGLCSDFARIVFLLAEALQDASAEILSFKISWQAQYLVRLEGDLTGSAHWKWRFICDADHRRHSFCVAGAVFGEFAGRLYLLRALEMTFHMWRRSLLTCILRGRRSIWWGCRVTSLSLRIGNEVS